MIFATACSGIGVPDLAAHKLGWSPLFACEREAFPRAILEERFGYGHGNGAPLLDDMTTIDGGAWPDMECFIAGTPCQSFSIAGLRKGLNDERGNLTLKFVEICHARQDEETRGARPFRWAVWENVPGVLSDRGNAFGNFISALVGGDAPALPPGSKPADFEPVAEGETDDRPSPPSWPGAGMVSGPRARLAWRVLDAQYFGVPQRRRRVFVVVSFGPGDPAAVLFEPRSVRGNITPRREAGEGIAPTISARPSGGGGLGTDFEPDGGLIEGGYVPDIVPQSMPSKWAKGSSGPAGDEFANLVAPPLAHALRGEGFDASEDGTGRGTPIIAFSCKDSGADVGEISPTLRAMGHGASHANAGGQVAIAYGIRSDATREGLAKTANADAAGNVRLRNPGLGITENLAPTLDSSTNHAVFCLQERAGAENPASGPDGAGFRGDGVSYTLEARANAPSVAFSIMPMNSGKDYKGRETDIAQPLMANGPTTGNQGGDFVLSSAVRRLTPKECERLQGLPDNFTLSRLWKQKRANWKRDAEASARWIREGREDTMTEAEALELAAHPDGPRYKAIGNAWAYPVGLWVLERLDAEDKRTRHI